MQVDFIPEQDAQMVAARTAGTDAESLVKRVALQFVDDADFRAAVLEASDCGASSSKREMDARFEEVLGSEMGRCNIFCVSCFNCVCAD